MTYKDVGKEAMNNKRLEGYEIFIPHKISLSKNFSSVNPTKSATGVSFEHIRIPNPAKGSLEISRNDLKQRSGSMKIAAYKNNQNIRLPPQQQKYAIQMKTHVFGEEQQSINQSFMSNGGKQQVPLQSQSHTSIALATRNKRRT